jgi:plastocyanin
MPALAVLFAGLAIADAPDAVSADGLVEITMSAQAPFPFIPNVTTIETGTTVRWSAAGPAPHTITSDGCGNAAFGACTFDSGLDVMLRADSPRDSFEFKFNNAGVYRFYCRIHGAPGGVGQSGVIVVKTPTDPAPVVAPPQPWLIRPPASLVVYSPREGEVITGDKVNVVLGVNGAQLRTAEPGITDPRFGHFHLVLDTSIDLKQEVPRAGTVPGVFHVATREFTLEGVTPGQHNLQVVWGFDNHVPVQDPITTTIRFQTVAASPETSTGVVRPPATGDAGIAAADSGTNGWLFMASGVVLLGLAGAATLRMRTARK